MYTVLRNRMRYGYAVQYFYVLLVNNNMPMTAIRIPHGRMTMSHVIEYMSHSRCFRLGHALGSRSRNTTVHLQVQVPV